MGFELFISTVVIYYSPVEVLLWIVTYGFPRENVYNAPKASTFYMAHRGEILELSTLFLTVAYIGDIVHIHFHCQPIVN